MERVELYAVQSLYSVLVGLLLLVNLSLVARLSPGQAPVGLAVAAVAVVLGGVGCWVLRAATRLWPRHGPLPRRPLVVTAGVCVAALAVAAALPEDPRTAVVLSVWGVLAVGVGGFRDPRVTGVVVVALPLVLGVPAGEPIVYAYGLGAGLFMLFTVRASLWIYGVVRELDGAKQAQTSLAVAEERLRFSRDVHDVLGRRLSEIAVQAELAARLAEAGDASAPARMEQVREVAHDALREARALARGYRGTDLDQELEGARSLLSAAGITTEVALDGLPHQWREPTGWVVREAVTNVLHHSRAARVRVTWTPGPTPDGAGTLQVRNDGAGDATTEGTPGSGLAGLAERLAPLGARLDAGRQGDTFVVEVVVPAADRTAVAS
ncbi:conserved membrane hypothetical protein [Nocardioides sp. AX2bis]|nr:conserved membrane hypothetical protein [Nocardioides sp. AX2bis]